MDIHSNEDIRLLVDSFYDKVKKDEVIGFIFHDIIGEDWSHHLPVMYQFWDTVLLCNAGYRGNPVMKHIVLDKKIPLKEEHFDRWLALWNDTVDSLFTGERADEAKNRASLMKNLIFMKVIMGREGKTIM